MTPALEALGRRAVNCKAFRWMPGMRAVRSVGGPLRACQHGHWVRDESGNDTGDVGEVPDLSDPCTIGGLLALVREAWDDPTCCVVPTPSGQWVIRGEPCIVGGPESRRWTGPCLGDTEADALVLALEAAP